MNNKSRAIGARLSEFVSAYRADCKSRKIRPVLSESDVIVQDITSINGIDYVRISATMKLYDAFEDRNYQINDVWYPDGCFTRSQLGHWSTIRKVNRKGKPLVYAAQRIGTERVRIEPAVSIVNRQAWNEANKAIFIKYRAVRAIIRQLGKSTKNGQLCARLNERTYIILADKELIRF